MASKRSLTSEEKQECSALKQIFISKKKEISGLTYESAADAVGINTGGGFSHYINGVNALNLEFAIKVAALLKCEVADFSPRLAKELPTHNASPHLDPMAQALIANQDQLTPRTRALVKKIEKADIEGRLTEKHAKTLQDLVDYITNENNRN